MCKIQKVKYSNVQNLKGQILKCAKSKRSNTQMCKCRNAELSEPRKGKLGSRAARVALVVIVIIVIIAHIDDRCEEPLFFPTHCPIMVFPLFLCTRHTKVYILQIILVYIISLYSILALPSYPPARQHLNYQHHLCRRDLSQQGVSNNLKLPHDHRIPRISDSSNRTW